MKLKEIVAEVDLLVANALSSEQKIGFINQIQRQLYRDYPLPSASHYFSTKPNQALYELPDNCQPDRLLAVYVNGHEHEYRGLLDSSSQKSYTIAGGKVLIHPMPTHHWDAYFMYLASPADLTVDDLDQSPTFHEDYHELLVLGCAKRIALIEKQFDLANQLELRYNTLSQEAAIKLSKSKLKRVRISRGWI